MKRARRMGVHPRHDLSNPTRRCVEATIRQGLSRITAPAYPPLPLGRGRKITKCCKYMDLCGKRFRQTSLWVPANVTLGSGKRHSELQQTSLAGVRGHQPPFHDPGFAVLNQLDQGFTGLEGEPLPLLVCGRGVEQFDQQIVGDRWVAFRVFHLQPVVPAPDWKPGPSGIEPLIGQVQQAPVQWRGLDAIAGKIRTHHGA